ncbi:MAG: DUF4252 domain-containing protein [Rikenellaceae bacterium]|jgi:hypothetical protein|nr:DUF4252 domain-containing protein [Rikenellaceae bacterium]
MKKLILLLVAAFPLLAYAQANTITSLYNTYSGKKGVSTVMVTPEMLSSVLKVNGVELKCSMMAISAERSLSFWPKDIQDMRDAAMKIASAPGYKMLMDVREEDETVCIYAREGAQGELDDVLIIVSEDDEISVIGIDGSIPANLLGKLSRLAD